MRALARGALGASLALALAVLPAGCDRVESWVAGRAVDRLVAGPRTDWLEDGALHLVLCGTGSPLPDPKRAGPCTAVLAAGGFYLVDVGPGAAESAALLDLPLASLRGVLLTHFHSDHIGELGEIGMQSWVAGRTEPLMVYGPPGVESVVDGFTQAYEADTRYRVAHHGEEAMPPSGARLEAQVVLAAPDAEAAVVLERDGLRVTAFPVDHEPVSPAYGYRFEYAGRSLVVSGDTAPSESLRMHAQGADVLVHEALAARLIEPVSRAARERGADRWAKLTTDVLDYHTTPAQAEELARDAGVRMLVLTHLVPSAPSLLAGRVFEAGVDVFPGETVVGEDGMHFILRSDSEAIERE